MSSSLRAAAALLTVRLLSHAGRSPTFTSKPDLASVSDSFPAASWSSTPRSFHSRFKRSTPRGTRENVFSSCIFLSHSTYFLNNVFGADCAARCAGAGAGRMHEPRRGSPAALSLEGGLPLSKQAHREGRVSVCDDEERTQGAESQQSFLSQ